MRPRALWVALLSLVAALPFAACGEDEGIAPAPLPEQGGAGPGSGGAGGGMPEAGVVKRTVFFRSPVGEVANNDLADGDFELSTSRDDYGQYGFRMFTTVGQPTLVETETGGLCRSGIQCGVIQKGQLMLLRGAAANHRGNVGWFWAKVPGNACNAVGGLLIACDTLSVIGTFKPDDPAPGADSWCRYSTAVTEDDFSLCFYITTKVKTGERALIDAAVLGPNDGTVHAKAVHEPPEPEVLDTLARVRETLRHPRPMPKRKVEIVKN